jgi:L-ribulose-5-phosphate 4-epimerase
MTQQEGVVKFQMDYTCGPALPYAELRELNAWRRILFMTNLIGEDPRRYGGFGYGNVSMRLDQLSGCGQSCFAISGTQTGALAELTREHYAIVQECWPEDNRVVATGPIKPSSESLTHGMIYNLDHTLRYVLHVHSPEIWCCARIFNIPTTRDDAAYGTPEMAEEVRRLFEDTDIRAYSIFAMGGHEHGIVAFGHCVAKAGSVMMEYLARALACN